MPCAFDQPPLTRHERAEKVKKEIILQNIVKLPVVLESLLDKYSDEGIEHIEDIKILTLAPFSELGTAVELISAFGGKPSYFKAVEELKSELYA